MARRRNRAQAPVAQVTHDVVLPDPRAGVPLKQFLAKAKKLTLRDRALIVEQAIMVVEGFHVNLPLKCAMYAVDPLRRLRLLRQRLQTLFNDDRLFHREMTEIFNSLNDIHTNYLLPAPFNDHSAWLPFTVEFCFDGGPTYLATKVIQRSFTGTAFREGVEILDWNGVPIARAVERAGARSPSGAGNVAARHAFGVYSLTLRPLKVLPPPDEEWVVVGYRAGRGMPRNEIRVPWLVSREEKLEEIKAHGSVPTSSIQRFRKSQFAPEQEDKSFRGRVVKTPHGKFGYLRIFDFAADDVGRFINGLIAEIKPLPRKGLIIDLRENPGGRTAAAERFLQVISPDHPQLDIEPTRLCFINTSRTLEFCKLQSDNTTLGPHGLHPWIESVERAMETGATYSASFPITDPKLCNAKGRLYPGPVIVITDGLTRSAAEVFSAGFQDHGGKILGVDKMTGGAGANVRFHHELKSMFEDASKSPFRPLPKNADFLIPFRRFQRVRRRAGNEIEDFGVRANFAYRMTRDDILKGNVDLINHAAKLLASKEFAPSSGRAAARRARSARRSSRSGAI